MYDWPARLWPRYAFSLRLLGLAGLDDVATGMSHGMCVVPIRPSRTIGSDRLQRGVRIGPSRAQPRVLRSPAFDLMRRKKIPGLRPVLGTFFEVIMYNTTYELRKFW